MKPTVFPLSTTRWHCVTDGVTLHRPGPLNTVMNQQYNTMTSSALPALLIERLKCSFRFAGRILILSLQEVHWLLETNLWIVHKHNPTFTTMHSPAAAEKRVMNKH